MNAKKLLRTLRAAQSLLLAATIAVTGCNRAASPAPGNNSRADAAPSKGGNTSTAYKTGPELIDIHGQPRHPLDTAGDKAAVVVFITNDCPVSNGYVPELNRIYDDYRARGVRLTLVHVDWELTDQAARAHATEYALRPPIVVDRKHALVRYTGAQITPEAVVYDASGKLVYRGRIDDQFTDFGDRRAAVSEHDLRNALDAVLAGKRVANPRVEAVGCFIPEM